MEEKKKFNKQDYDNQYIKTHKDRINFLMDKGTKDRINLAAAKEGTTASEFIRRSIEERLYKFGFEKQIAVEDPELQAPKTQSQGPTSKINI